MLMTPDLAQRFVDARTGASVRTLAAYRGALEVAVAWALVIDEDVLKAFDHGLARRTYRKTVRERLTGADGKALRGRIKTVPLKYADATRRLYVTVLKQFLYWLEAEGLAPPNFNRSKCEDKLRAARGRRARSVYQHREPDRELMRLVEHFDTLPTPSPHARDANRLTVELLRNRALLHTFRATGARVSEVLSLKRSQVQNGRIDEVRIIGKGGVLRTLFLDRPALAAIAAYCNARSDSFEPLFVSHRRGLGQALTASSAWQIVRRAAEALGLKGLASPHMFRHYLGEDMLRAGVRLEGVQAVLGHKDIATTRKVYAPANAEEAREALRRYRAE